MKLSFRSRTLGTEARVQAMPAAGDFSSSTFGFLAWGFAALAVVHFLLVPQFPEDSIALLLGSFFLGIFGVFADEDSRVALYSWAVLPVGGILFVVLQGQDQSAVTSLGGLFTGLSFLLGMGSLVCFVLVVVKMFQNDQPVWGTVSLVLLLACGIGGLVAFIYGWAKATEWRLDTIMWVWTGCFIGGIVFSFLSVASGVAGM